MLLLQLQHVEIRGRIEANIHHHVLGDWIKSPRRNRHRIPARRQLGQDIGSFIVGGGLAA